MGFLKPYFLKSSDKERGRKERGAGRQVCVSFETAQACNALYCHTVHLNEPATGSRVAHPFTSAVLTAIEYLFF